MKLIADTHTHTLASGHAYSTMQENSRVAQENGIEIIAMTDHGPALRGSAGLIHFYNLRVIPSMVYGVRVLKGVEANILDYNGSCDMPDDFLKKMEFVIASYHDICITPSSVEENTAGLESILANPYVDAVAHPGNPGFQVDIDRVVRAAYKYNKLIEINNSSFYVRKGCEDNCLEFARKCRQYGVRVTCGSDAHVSFDVGRFDKVEALLEEAGLPEELVICTSTQRFEAYLKERNDRVRAAGHV